MRRASLFFCVLVTLTSCTGSDPSTGANGATNGATSGPTNSATSGSTANAANTTPNTNSGTGGNTTQPRAEPYIQRFSHQFPPGTQRLHFTTDAYGNATIGTGVTGVGNVARLPADVAAEFDMAHLGADTLERMRSGWGCRDAADSEDYRGFEARIVENGTTTQLQDITGCVIDDDPSVVLIVEAMRRLETIYL